MRIAAMWMLPLIVGAVQAADVNPRVLKLIPPDTQFVIGGDLARYRTTPWSDLLPWRLDPNISGQVDQVIAMGAGSQDFPSLTVFVGTPHAEQTEGGPRLLRLDGATWLFGDGDAVQEAVQRLNRDIGPSELALKAKELSQTYDNWFVLLKPLAQARPNPDGIAASLPRAAADLIEMVEEVSGGIRLGPYSEVRIEVVLKTAGDAVTLAGLGRWLPGLLQLMEPNGMPARMVELAENLQFQSAGRTASMSFTISEENAKKLLKTVWDRQPVQ